MRSLLLTLTALVAIIVAFNKLVYDSSPLPDHAQLMLETNRYKKTLSGISFTDSNFSDLHVLDSLFKTKRILMLGEMNHHDGQTFLAKSRLIRYLHEKQGYHIVLYEAGQYDMWVMNEEMENATMQVPKEAQGGLGLFYLWWQNKENSPLIAYYQESKDSMHPITLGGFDIQFSGATLRDKRAQLLEQYCSKNKIDLHIYPLLQKQLSKLDYLSMSSYANRQLDSKAKKQLLTELDQLENAIKALQRNEQQQIYSRYIADMKNNFKRTWNYAPGSLQSMHIRDSLMAQNLTYQMDSLYRNEKVIIWCGNIHAFSAPYNKEYRPLGTYIKKKYGEQAYILGFSSYGRSDDNGRIVEKPSKLAIENVFHDTNTPYFFLNLQGLPERSKLKQSFVSIMDQQIEEDRKWSNFFDGIYYIDINKQPSYLKK